MPDTKITALTALTAADPANDVLPIVDVSDTTMAASGTTKKISINNVLGASGTATLASATITGDLTVDTSTLKVDSANNRVGIRTASPSEPLTVDNTSGVTTGAIRILSGDQSNSRLSIQNLNGQAYHLVAGNPGASNAGFALYDNTAAATRWYVDSTGVHTWQNVGGVAGTAMTLNSTGLGVGATSLSRKFEVHGTPVTIGGTATGMLVTVANNGTAYNASPTSGLALWNKFNSSGSLFPSAAIQAGKENATDGNYAGFLSLYTVNSVGSPNEQMRIDSSGNVGIGVTPSARFHSKAGAVTQGGIIETSGANALLSFADAGTSSYTRVQIGSSGNNLAAFINSVQSMTLDASGNLLVGKTAASVTTVGFQTLANGEASVAMAASTSASSTLNVWSTGAAAFRFYVAMNGTISATNTTISAISDARLKENVQDIDVGLGAILALKPRKFDWKAGKGKDIKGDRGFIAQEFEQVFPNLIDEWKDPAPEGEAPYKSVRQDLIPVLVKAIQELTARVQTLETR